MIKQDVRILLINPPSGLYIREDRCQVPVKGLSATATRPPLDLAYLAAMALNQGVIAKIADYPAEGQGWDDYARDLLVFAPAMVVFSVTTPTLVEDMRAVQIAKAAGAVTVAKGAHFVTEAQAVMQRYPELDIAIQGEYEEVFGEIVADLPLESIRGIIWRQAGVVVENPPRPFTRKLDELPYPARQLLNNGLYRRPDTGELQTTIQTSRGCPSSCIFCLAGMVSGKVPRARSPENIVGELRECVEKYGIRNFFFRADTFTLQADWVKKVCSAIIAAGLDISWVCNSRVDTVDAAMLRIMKQSGCWLISFGIESGSQDGLREMRKGTTLVQARAAVDMCRDAGIKTFCFYVIGLPWEDKESIRLTTEFAIKLDSDFAEFHPTTPFPGTDLHRLVISEGLWEQSVEGAYSYDHSSVRTRFLTASEVNSLRRRAVRKFYLRPAYITRTLLASGPAQWKNYIKYGLGMVLSLFNY